ncbi:tribbles homolog 1 [Phyllopteryx taeniolatus]|uniref:tribbles homolog 1 n=1 Tax=Phyllopteryx taeniolatus TaxID=161469 RepID=UPI002AD29DAA|nr:tribbles homolog 1 [Phyllopteryx taeniolatus]
MSVPWSGAAPACVRPAGAAHKRLDSDSEAPRPPAKRARRLSSETGDAHGGLLGGTAATATATAVTQRGPSRIGPFLLVPAAAERDGVHCRAVHVHTGDELLCKVFSMADYQRKIRAYWAAPPHPGVSAVREVILGEREAYVFLDRDFGDMHALVKSRRRLDEARARPLFRQMAQAVAHCHLAGVVLGDLKLRKFVFADENRTQVRLESLEDCRVLEDPRDDAMCDTHGCPAYVSPEILSGAAPYSGKMADMWSLGVVLYTMLAGRYPFHDADPAALFSKIRRGHCCLPEGISPGARCLVQSLLRKEPGERLTASELLAHPWFRRQTVECSPAEQTVPSFDVEDDDDHLLC